MFAGPKISVLSSANADKFYKNLVLWLRCEGANNGTTFVDSSRSNLQFTSAGVITTTANARTGSSSASASGSGNNLTTTSAGSVLSFSTGPCTFEYWIYPTGSTASSFGIFTSAANTTAPFPYWTYYNGGVTCTIDSAGTVLGFSIGNGSGGAAFSATISTIPLNTWTHVAYVREGTQFRTYINGTLIYTDTIGASVPINCDGGFGLFRHDNRTTYTWINGNIDEFKVYNVAKYTADFVPETLVQASYLVVAGGGGGGYNAGSGGGAGGMLSGATKLTKGTAYSVVVGAGGAASGLSGASTGGGSNGANSTFAGLTAIGGGAGGSGGTAGGNGGSGGGGGINSTSYPAGTGTVGQGNAGALSGGAGGYTSGGGGGGAGGAAPAWVSGSASAGGVGLSNSITGAAVFYAGGGGGAGDTRSAPATGGAGGNGGGGTGGGYGPVNATAGTVNTGGGGGGGGYNSTMAAAGGSGVVILSIPTAYYTGITTGSPTVTVSGSNTVLKFTSSGSYTA